MVLCQPQRLQVQVGHREREVRESVPADVQDMKLGAGPDLVGQGPQLVLPQAEHSQVDQIPDLVGKIVQPVAVHVQVGQLRQVADRVGEEGEVVLGQNQLLEGNASGEKRGKKINEEK